MKQVKPVTYTNQNEHQRGGDRPAGVVVYVTGFFLCPKQLNDRLNGIPPRPPTAGSERDNAADTVRGRNTVRGTQRWDPAKSQDFVGRGGARERTQFSPQAETETGALCSDVVQGALFKGQPCWGSNPQIAGAKLPSPSESPLTSFQPGGLKVS